MNPKDKYNYLYNLYHDVDTLKTSDWRVASMYEKEDGTIGCPRYLFSEINKNDVNKISKLNQRELLKSEICLEYDPSSKEKNVAEKEFSGLLKELKKDNVKFRAFGTEDYRALRIETFWYKLGMLKRTERESIREHLIEKYGCDLQLKSDKHLVSFGIHYKTNKLIKVLDENNFGVNDSELLSQEFKNINGIQDLQNRSKGFILNDSEIPLIIDHALGNIKLEKIEYRYYGVQLFEEVEKKINNGSSFVTVKNPVLVLENRTLMSENRTKINFSFNSVVCIKDSRFSLEGIKKFLRGDQVELKKTFELFKKKFTDSMVYEEAEWYDLLSIWCMVTYFQDLVTKSLIIKVEGISGTAKSKTGRLICNLSFNGKKFLCPTPANFFRYRHNNKATLFIEEAERLFDDSKTQQKGDSDLVEYLNGSYEVGNTVPRQNDKNINQTDEFDPYGWTCIGSIKPLKGALEKRSITLLQIKAGKDDKRGEVEIEVEDEGFKLARDNMYICGLLYWREFKKTYNSLERGYNLQNREWLVSKPIIAMAKLIDSNLADSIGNFLSGKFDKREQQISPDSWDYFILLYLIQKTSENKEGVFLSNEELKVYLEKNNQYSKINQKTVGTLMQKLGFDDFKHRGHSGIRGYNLNFYKVADICIRNQYLTEEDVRKHLSDLSLLSPNSISIRDFDTFISDKQGDKQKSIKQDSSLGDKSDRQTKCLRGRASFFTDFKQNQIFTLNDILPEFDLDSSKCVEWLNDSLTKGSIIEIKPNQYEKVLK